MEYQAVNLIAFCDQVLFHMLNSGIHKNLLSFLLALQFLHLSKIDQNRLFL